MLLDTSAYSAFFRGHPDLESEFQRAGEILMSPVVLGELRAGFRQGHRRRENETLLRELIASPRVRRIAVDDGTADRYGEIFTTLKQNGRPIPTNDIWIAASAMQHGCYLLTTDTHYRYVPQVLAEIFPPR